VRLPQQQIKKVAKENDRKDRNTANGEQLPSHVLLTLGIVKAPAQQERNNQSVTDHNREGYRIHDHHGGSCGEAADERQQRDGVGTGR